MLLGEISKIRAAAYAGRRITWITPCKRSAARGKKITPCHSTPKWVELLTEFSGAGDGIPNPELRFACTGLPICKTYGLLENKNGGIKNNAKVV